MRSKKLARRLVTPTHPCAAQYRCTLPRWPLSIAWLPQLNVDVVYGAFLLHP